MNPRERTLATVVLIAGGLGVAYYGVDRVFIRARGAAEERLAGLKKEREELEETIASREKLAEAWMRITSRTLSFDKTVAVNQFDLDLKRRAKEHHLESLDFRTQQANMKVGGKELKKIVCRINGEGSYTNVMNFLWSLYDTPYLCQITKLALSPMEVNRRRDMKIHTLIVETPLLSPYIDENVPEAKDAKAADTLTDLGMAAEGPARPEPPLQAAYTKLQERNIFLVYVPAPENTITVKNDDSEPAKVRIEFEWDGKKEEQPELAVDGTSTKESPIFLGDAATAWAEYADGHKIGPERFDKTKRRPWTFELKPHTPPPPPPPPGTVDLAVQNQDKGRVFVTVEVTSEDGQKRKLPPMMIEPNAKLDVDKFQAREVRVAAAYDSGEAANDRTLHPSAEKQTFVVPKKGEAVVIEQKDQPVEDPKPDPNMTLTAILAYPGDEKTGGGEKFPGIEPAAKEAKAAEITATAATQVAASEAGMTSVATTQPAATTQVADAPVATTQEATESAAAIAAEPAVTEETDVVTEQKPVAYIEEFIALNARTHKREIKVRGSEVDQGVLIVIHPMGGVVKYKDTGNCYFYPLGEKFTSRVLMEKAVTPEDFVAAIDKAVNTEERKLD